jgi:hypothetical protein
MAGRANVVQRKDMRNKMIKLLCKAHETEISRQILHEPWCGQRGLNEPVIFQTEEDYRGKRPSILGKGVHPAETAMWWIVGEMLFLFWRLNTITLLTVLLSA